MDELIKVISELRDLIQKKNADPYVISVSAQDIVTDNKTIRLRYNKCIVQNMSNYKITLFRTYTLVPGQSLVLGSEENDQKLYTDMEITFDTVLFDSNEADVKRVEILQINRMGPEQSFSDTPSKSEVKPLF